MKVWQSIDLAKDGVVEASAGTGKTYTIEHLVGRYVQEREIPIGQLLLVTYTEKAAGEMKDRIRRHLADLVAKAETGSPGKRHLQEQLDAFDTASISTIHSFCQSVLREYAFENGQVFDLQLVDESELSESVLREIMRQDWPRWAKDDFGMELAELLDQLGFANMIEKTFQTLLEVAAKTSADVTFHVDRTDDMEDLTRLRHDVLALGQPPFAERYRMLNVNGRSLAPRAEIVDTLDAWLECGTREAAAEFWTLASNKSFFSQKDPVARKPNGLACLRPDKWKQAGRNDHEVMPELNELVDVLVEHESVFVNAHANYQARERFVDQTVCELRKRLDAVKAERGLMTYDDMLRRVAEALDVKRNPATAETLLAALRQRYRIALVDEFQDTDPVQWEIFRRIFHDSPDNRLIVVGDPKQAIYSFRGADLATYFAAKDSITTPYELPDSFRSTPDLLAAFNALFATPAWFGTGGLTYNPVGYPANQGQPRPVVDGTNLPPVVAVDVLAGASDDKLANLAAFTAAEIARYMRARDAFRIEVKDTNGDGEERTTDIPLRYLDFCLLVRTRTSAKPFERALRKAGVPYCFYKKPGVYQSDEALHIQYLLALLARPSDEKAIKLALTTRFFDVTPDRLPDHQLGADPELRQLLDRWLDQCAKRQWGRLFESMMSDTGLLFRESRQADGERRVANYRQIFDELEAVAMAESLDVAGLRKRVAQRIRKHVEVDEETDRHRLETEEDTVRIMTMHASKGLQFPIVFVGDKTKKSLASRQSVFTYHASSGERKVSLRKDASECETREMLEEQKRLFYVALTRAKYRVYLPYSRAEDTAQPFDTLTNPAIEQAIAGGAEIKIIGPDHAWAVPAAGDADGTPRPPSSDSPPTPELDFPFVPELYPRQRRIDSFSSLAKHGRTTASTPSFAGDNAIKGEDEVETDAPSADTPAEPSASQAGRYALLPRSNTTGNAFHDTMETLARGGTEDEPGPSFNTFADIAAPTGALDHPAIAKLIDQAMGMNGLMNYQAEDEQGRPTGSAREELATLVWRTVRTPLPGMDKTLAALSPVDMSPELEFHFSEAEDYLGTDSGVADGRRGLLNGYIDLLFECAGKLYILDWKTNTLDAYDPPAIQAAMETADYLLQYRIYTLAVLAWLSRTHGERATNLFGGTYYLFVRGIDPADRRSGVFFDPWRADKEQDYRAFVLARLKPMKLEAETADAIGKEA